jgi:hypothetical protein
MLERSARARQAHGEQRRRRPQRLELEAVAEKMARLVALRRPKLRVHGVGKYAHHRDARMKLQVLPDLPGAIREISALLEDHRCRHAARRENHGPGVHAKVVARPAREGRHDATGDAEHAPTLGEHLLHAQRGQDARATPEGGGDVADVHGLLGPRATAREALPTAPTASHVPGTRLARVAKGVAAALEQQVAFAEHVLRRGRNAQELAHRVVVRIEVPLGRVFQFEVRAPILEHEVGSAVADRGVDERAAAERDGLHGGHHRAARGAQTALAHRARHRERPIDLEVGRREGRALLEECHALAGVGQLLGDDGAAWARPDHGHVHLLGEVAVVLREYPQVTGAARRRAHCAPSAKRESIAVSSGIGVPSLGSVRSSRE